MTSYSDLQLSCVDLNKDNKRVISIWVGNPPSSIYVLEGKHCEDRDKSIFFFFLINFQFRTLTLVLETNLSFVIMYLKLVGFLYFFFPLRRNY